MLKVQDLEPGMIVKVHSPVPQIDRPRVLLVKSHATMNPNDYGWWIFGHEEINAPPSLCVEMPGCSYSEAYQFEVLDRLDLTIAVLAIAA